MLVDIYDGDHEPMTYHGKTFISKVTLCQVISKFGVYAPLLVNKCYGRQYEFVLLGLATRRECDSHALWAVCICCRVCSDHLIGRMKRTANVPFLLIHSSVWFFPLLPPTFSLLHPDNSRLNTESTEYGLTLGDDFSFSRCSLTSPS